jgi:8-oxo-dGTP pyrophosphatase MutT (NUDIX family)
MNLSAADFKQRVKKLLQNRCRIEMASPSLEPAAVLMPIYEKDGKLHLLLTRRTDQVAHHKKQISFPGGAREVGDKSLLHTALRESTEEIGLDAASVEVLGILDDIPTVASNFVITPFVVFFPYPAKFTINPKEVAEILAVPLETLLDKFNFREELQTIGENTHPIYFYNHRGHIIWGATARIIKEFLDLLHPDPLPFDQ